MALLEGLGVDALGINCGTGPKNMLPVVERLVKAASVPVLVSPNAGLPRMENGRTVYDITADEFAAEMAKLAALGIQAAGGCCGTTPEHIRALSTLLDAYADSPYIPEKQMFLACCAKRAVPLSAFESCPTIRISERKEAFDDMRHAPALKLDVCGMSPSKIHVQLAQMEKQLPQTALAFIVQTAAEAEAALKRYCGVAPVYCQGDAYRVAQLAARYGAELME